MESSSDLAKIEKLNKDEDWPTWKFEIRVMLRAAELMDVVSGTRTQPVRSQNETEEIHQDALSKFTKEDYKAQRIIVMALGKQSKIHVMNCGTSKEMWDKLSTVYEQKSKLRVHLFQQKFYNFKKAPEDNIATCISKLETIVHVLKDLGTNIPSDMVLTKILAALPEEYNHFHSAWESTADVDRTIKNLTSRLIMEEIRLAGQRQNTLSEALFAGVVVGSQKCYHCGGTGYISSEESEDEIRGKPF